MTAKQTRGYGGKPPGQHQMGEGLVLHVSPKGKSAWFARVKIDGKRVKRKLSDASASCDTADAYRLLKDFLLQAQPTSPSMKSVLEDWGKAKSNPKLAEAWSEDHYKKTMSRIEKSLSGIWDRPLASVKLVEINAFLLEGVDNGGSRDTASRVWNWLREAWQEQVDLGYIEYCPMSKKPARLRVAKGDGFASYGPNIPKLKMLYRNIRMSNNNRSVRNVGMLCLLLGLRINEITPRTKDEVRDGCLWIPRESMKMKTGKRSKVFRVPLSPAAQAIMDEAAEFSVNEYLFPGPTTQRPVRDAGVEKMYRKFANQEHVPHGCRTSLNSWAIEQGYPLAACKIILDHSIFNDATGRYTDVELYEDRKDIILKYSEVITAS